MKLSNRDNIAKEVEVSIFYSKTVWSFIFKPQEGLRFITGGPFVNDTSLFRKMVDNVTEKLRKHGASLKEVYVVIDSERKKLDWQSANGLMTKIIREDLPVIFKVQIQNKNYEYQVK
jgi:hypothetical protein